MTALSLPRLDPSRLRRALGAGTIWGVVVAGGLTVVDALGCGVCLDALPATVATALLAGFATISPLVYFAPRAT